MGITSSSTCHSYSGGVDAFPFYEQIQTAQNRWNLLSEGTTFPN